MDTGNCPHCGAANGSGASFCSSCGKALPQPADAAGPRIIPTSGIADTQTGRSLQADELHKQSRKAAGALLVVAILQCLFGLVIVVAGQSFTAELGVQLSPVVYVTVFGIGVIFFVLYLWARKSPLPAAITGLVLFVSVHLLDAVADPRALARGILLKIIIVVVLARAISAGVRHRRIRQEMLAA